MSSIESPLLFLCGFPSSGTDLLKLLLNAHPDVRISGEFPLLPALSKRFSGQISPINVADAVRALIDCDTYDNLKHHNLRDGFPLPASMSMVYRCLLGSESYKWAGNKTPQNAENVDRLEMLFPGSRYILIVRDVRDVALSWRNKWGKDPLLCAHKWQLRMNTALKLLDAYSPDRYMVIRYESLIADHVDVARALCEFLEIGYNDAMEHYHVHVDEVVPGKLNYGRPIQKRNSQKWRGAFNDMTVSRIEGAAFETMQKFGYTPLLASQAKPLTFTAKAVGYQRDLMSMLTVGNRALHEQRPMNQFASKIRFEIVKRLGRYSNKR